MEKLKKQWEAYNNGYLVWELLLDSNRTNSYTKFIRENVMFIGEVLDLLKLDLNTNISNQFTYFEAGFSLDNFYSSFAKKQNHWGIDKQKTGYYKQNTIEYIRELKNL